MSEDGHGDLKKLSGLICRLRVIFSRIFRACPIYVLLISAYVVGAAPLTLFGENRGSVFTS